MAELANRLGYGDLYPQTEEEMVRFALQGSGYSLEEVREAGGWVKMASPMMEYKKWQKGGLRKDGQPGFETPTGKFEIYSTVLEDYGYEPLPKYIEPKEGPVADPLSAKAFPLVFNSGARPQSDFHSQHHGIKKLAALKPEPTVDIHPADAAPRNIKSGDLVQVKTPRGSVKFRAVVTEDIVPGAVECSQGGGTPIGPSAWQQHNVNELTDLSNYDEISGFPVYKALLCDVIKIEDGVESQIPASEGIEHPELFITAHEKAPSGKRHSIYLDNAATTRVNDKVRETMLPFLGEIHGNPSSIHSRGREAKEAVEKARRTVARFLNCSPREIIFTGGGSESDNMALKGIAFAHRDKGNHIITSRIEHPAILESCRFLEKIGFEVTYLEVDSTGMVQPSVLEKHIQAKTILVSVMMANNEVGAIQPVKQLCEIAHRHGVYFHTDAVQAVGKIGIDVRDSDVDLLSFSAHKLNGPKGVGVLFLKKGVPIEPLIHGGKQEVGLRAGTHNVPAIAGLGAAVKIAMQRLNEAERIKTLRDRLEYEIKELIPGTKLNGHPESRLPNILNLTLPELRGESLVIAMDQHGIALSSGSACKSGSPEPTHVLLAMGKSREEAHCAVRFSLSYETGPDDITATVQALKQVLEEMETTVRFLPCK
jgi:cysteine desulfurase NifS